ncbi:MAG TPA: 3-hydroxyacyl-ACP dehydratase FabZ family protein [Nitrospirota bacterium]|jgi:3-hydroxyacyl-[acyl-carrier-protein] dehydratase
MNIGRQDINATIPHRYPFLFIDRVIELEPGVRAAGLMNITADSPFAGMGKAGCFPQLLLIEALAQLGAVAGAAGVKAGCAGPGYLAAMTDVKFGRRPVVGDSILLVAEHRAKMGQLVMFNATAEIDGEAAAEATLTFSLPGAIR